MCLVLMLSFAACKNKDGGSDTTAPDTTEGTTSSLEDIINALNGVDTTDSSNPASTTEATEPETMPKTTARRRTSKRPASTPISRRTQSAIPTT